MQSQGTSSLRKRTYVLQNDTFVSDKKCGVPHMEFEGRKVQTQKGSSDEYKE